MSLGGLSDKINLDADIVKLLSENEAEEKLTKEQKEVLKLMTANREQTQYKTALASTIEAIRSGKTTAPKKLRKETDNG